MLTPRTLLSLVLLGLALFSQAGPVVIRDNLIRLPLAKKVNVTSAAQILKEDQARATRLVSRLTSDVENDPVNNKASFYSATVNVGSPGTACKSHVMV